jgi:hypothetical protein
MLIFLRPLTPVWHLSRQSDYFSVLHSNFGRRWSSHKVEINDASDGVILEILTSFCSVVDLDVHAVAVQEEDTMCTICTTMIKIHWVISVQIAASRNGVSITRPKSPGVICSVQLRRCQRLASSRAQYVAYLKWIRVLAESVEVRILRKLSTKSQVLRLEDEIRSSSVEQSGCMTAAAGDCK